MADFQDIFFSDLGSAMLQGGGTIPNNPYVDATGALRSQPVLTNVSAPSTAGALSSAPQGITADGTPFMNITKAVPSQQTQRSAAPLAIQFPKLPNRNIGMDEALIRIGGAGMGGAAQGGLASLSAMTGQYGDIQDYNRSRALEDYNAKVNQFNAEQKRQLEMAKLAAEGKPKEKELTPKQQLEIQEEIGVIDQSLGQMNDLLGKLQSGGVTGIWDTWLAGIYDKAAGSQDRLTRLALMDLKVDATLLKTAQTKGAISDSEMKLFQQPTPSIDDQETVWIGWIKKRQEALQKIRKRLSENISVDDPASAEQVESFNSMGAEQPDNLAAADKIVAGM